MQLRWTPAARRNLQSVHDFIAGDNPGAAVGIVLEIVRQVAMLAQYPALGRPGRVEGTRELVISRLPYIVPYNVAGDMVRVLGVLHGSMKWPERL